MQNSVLHGVCIELCLNSEWTQPPYIDELFQNLNSFNYQAAWFSKQFDVKLLKPRPRLLTDCPVLAYFRPQPVCFSTLKQLKWQQCLISNAGGFEIGCKSEHKNLNFSESLRAQWISFVFDGNAPLNTEKTQERGEVSCSSLSLKATFTRHTAVFDKVKRVLFYMTIEEF